MSDYKSNIGKNSHSRGSDNRQSENDFKRSPYYSLCIKYYILHIINISSILINTRQNKTTCCMALNISQVIMKWS